MWPLLLHGLEVGVVKRLARHLDLPVAPVLNVAGIARSTYDDALRRQQRLGAKDSESIYNLAKVIEAAEATFWDDRHLARTWLSTPRSTLADLSPLQAAGTSVGAKEVLDLLERVEHGVFF